VALVVAAGATLPVYARAVAGEKAHVCHCHAAGPHANCDCPVCFPDREVDLVSLEQMLKGRCGDDDLGWQTISHPAVLSAIGVMIKAPVSTATPTLIPVLEIRSGDPPDPRPPRSSSFVVFA